jgi:hypothetical protein
MLPLTTYYTYVNTRLLFPTNISRHSQTRATLLTKVMRECSRVEVVLLHHIEPACLPFDGIKVSEGEHIAVGVTDGAIAAADFVGWIGERGKGNRVTVGFAVASAGVGGEVGVSHCSV